MTEIKNITAALYEAARRREDWSIERGEALAAKLANLRDAETAFSPQDSERCGIFYIGGNSIACIWTKVPLVGLQRDYVSQIKPLVPKEVVTFVFDAHDADELVFEEAAFEAAFPGSSYIKDEQADSILDLYFHTVQL